MDLRSLMDSQASRNSLDAQDTGLRDNDGEYHIPDKRPVQEDIFVLRDRS